MSVNVYGVCDNNCKHPVYTREEVLSLLQQAINNGSLLNIDADYAAIKQIVSDNGGANVKFWTGTEAEFNALDPAPAVGHFIPRRAEDGTIYICIDDTTISSLPTAEQVEEAIASASKHEHSADDITDGILSVERGGTGATSLHGGASLMRGLFGGGVVSTGNIAVIGSGYGSGGHIPIKNLPAVLGAVNVEAGSYVGTGVGGQSSPCTLTFGFEPKFVIVQAGGGIKENTNGGGLTNGFIWSNGLNSWGNINFETSGKTVHWYSLNSSTQLNMASTEYYYFAIG